MSIRCFQIAEGALRLKRLLVAEDDISCRVRRRKCLPGTAVELLLALILALLSHQLARLRLANP